MRPCRHNAVVSGCHICRLWRDHAGYRRLWDGEGAALASGPCRHLGTNVVGYRQCPTCKGNVRLKEYACAAGLGVNGRTVPAHDCGRCAGYLPANAPEPVWVAPPVFVQPAEPRPFGDVRHLLYHILPVRGNARWQRNVQQLREYIGLFNGRKLVAVMYDVGKEYRHVEGTGAPDGARLPLRLDPPEAVEAALADTGCEFVRVPNDPNLREVASHGPLFSALAATYRPGDVALWAHAKGTTRRAGHPAKRWADVLYEAMLAYWPAVLEVLRTHPIAGCFKKLGRGWNANQSRSDWHYSGSWFWLRCADFFSRDWRKIDQFWSGIESAPSQQFDCAEAGTIFFEGQVPGINLYSMRYWDRVVHHAWVRWKQDHAHQRTDLGAMAIRASEND